MERATHRDEAVGNRGPLWPILYLAVAIGPGLYAFAIGDNALLLFFGLYAVGFLTVVWLRTRKGPKG